MSSKLQSITSGNRIVAKNVNKHVFIYSIQYNLRNNKT
jgi:hypothetical protein